MRRWRFLVWLLPPVLLLSIFAILYGPALTQLWNERNQMPVDQLSQVQMIGDELRNSHQGLLFFQEPSRNHITFEILDVPDNDDQEEIVSWFRDAKARHSVTFEMSIEFYEKGKIGESPNPAGGNTKSSGQGKKLLKRVDV
jgi:hypothetical protein